VNTKDRKEYLLIALSSLLAQTYPDWDLFISDASADPVINDERVSRLLTVFKKYNHNVTYLTDQSAGIPATYQKMLEMSTTDWVVRQEDDVWFEPEMLERLVETMEKDDRCGAVAPCTPRFDQTGGTSTLPDKLRNGFVMVPSALAPNMGLIHEAVDQQHLITAEDRTYDVCTLHGGSLYRRKAALDAGGFCTHFSPVGHREETMFYLRVYFAGWNLKVRTVARLWHFESSFGGSRSKGAMSDERQNFRRADEQRFQLELQVLLRNYPDRVIDVFDSAPSNM
jgi:GT2 family glycosyltransferase